MKMVLTKTAIEECILLFFIIGPAMKAVRVYRRERRLVDRYYAVALWLCIIFILFSIFHAVLADMLGFRLHSAFMISLAISLHIVAIIGIFFLLRWWLLYRKIRGN